MPPKLLPRPSTVDDGTVGCGGGLERHGQLRLARLPAGHRRIGDRLRAPAARRALVESHQPVGQRTPRTPRTAGRSRGASSRSRATGLSRKITKKSAPSAGPRKERMPPMMTIASSSPEKRDRDRLGRGHAVVEQQQHAGQPGDARRGYEGHQLVSGRWDSPRRRARCLFSRIATSTLPSGERWKRHKSASTANATAATSA